MRLLDAYLREPYTQFIERDQARVKRNVLDEGPLLVQGALRPIALALTVVATVTYGPSIVDLYRRAATYVAKAPAIRVMLGHCLPQIGGRISFG